MDCNRLLGDELTYELRVRGLELGSTVAEKRTMLSQAFRRERSGTVGWPDIVLEPAEELSICSAKLDQLMGDVQEFNKANADNEYKRIRSRLLHVDGRIRRLSVSNGILERKKANLQDLCRGLFDALEDALRIARLTPTSHTSSILDEPNLLLPEVVLHESRQEPTVEAPLIVLDEVPDRSTISQDANRSRFPLTQHQVSNSSSQMQDLSHRLNSLYVQRRPADHNSTNSRRVSFPSLMHTDSLHERDCSRPTVSSPYNRDEGRSNFPSSFYDNGSGYHSGYVPFAKWNIFFDGNNSVTSFIEDIEEMAEARGVSKSRLFLSASELFKGDALLWYRPRKGTFLNWEDLLVKLRDAFLPPDYEVNLMNDIRKRTQGDDEKLILYISRMQGLFSKLTRKPSVSEQVALIKRNLLPYLQRALALQNFNTIDDLLNCGRIVEESHWRAEHFCPPPTNPRMMLEPSFAYKRATTAKPLAIHSIESTSSETSLVPEITTVDSTKSRKMLCWNCKQSNHLRKDCKQPHRVACFRCGTAGYTIKNCPTCSGNGQMSH